MGAKKILFIVGDFAEDYEVTVPFQALTALQTDDSIIEPHAEIASSLRFSQ